MIEGTLSRFSDNVRDDCEFSYDIQHFSCLAALVRVFISLENSGGNDYKR